jgi:hypothetical protein
LLLIELQQPLTFPGTTFTAVFAAEVSGKMQKPRVNSKIAGVFITHA